MRKVAPPSWALLCLLLAPACGEDNPGSDGSDASSPADTGQVIGRDAGTIPDTGSPDSGDPGMCVDTPLYTDEDGDDFGVGAVVETQCLLPSEQAAGLGRQTDDCAPTDTWRHPGAPEICGDNVDDDCDEMDVDCPTTNTADLDIPSWDCVSGTPPSNVYAWALFSSGGDYFEDNGCFVLYEGLQNEFYVARVNLNRKNPPAGCETSINGCTCPSLSGWPSYDRRLYAFTREASEPCAEVRIIDHGGEDQAVSSDCRKYLYQLHYYDIPYTYFGQGIEVVQHRLDLFPQVEIACASEQYQQLPFQSLLTTNWQTNAGFQKK